MSTRIANAATAELEKLRHLHKDFIHSHSLLRAARKNLDASGATRPETPAKFYELSKTLFGHGSNAATLNHVPANLDEIELIKFIANVKYNPSIPSDLRGRLIDEAKHLYPEHLSTGNSHSTTSNSPALTPTNQVDFIKVAERFTNAAVKLLDKIINYRETGNVPTSEILERDPDYNEFIAARDALNTNQKFFLENFDIRYQQLMNDRGLTNNFELSLLVFGQAITSESQKAIYNSYLELVEIGVEPGQKAEATATRSPTPTPLPMKPTPPGGKG